MLVYSSSRFSVIFTLFLSFGRKTRICVFPLWLLLVARGTLAEGLAFPISYNILEALFVGSPGENILLFSFASLSRIVIYSHQGYLQTKPQGCYKIWERPARGGSE